MARNTSPNAQRNLQSRCFRVSALGRVCGEPAGMLPSHLADLLDMCRHGLWFEDLRQFMPPRTLEESLHALLEAGLLDVVAVRDQAEPAAQPARAPAWDGRRLLAWGA